MTLKYIDPDGRKDFVEIPCEGVVLIGNMKVSSDHGEYIGRIPRDVQVIYTGLDNYSLDESTTSPTSPTYAAFKKRPNPRIGKKEYPWSFYVRTANGEVYLNGSKLELPKGCELELTTKSRIKIDGVEFQFIPKSGLIDDVWNM